MVSYPILINEVENVVPVPVTLQTIASDGVYSLIQYFERASNINSNFLIRSSLKITTKTLFEQMGNMMNLLQ